MAPGMKIFFMSTARSPFDPKSVSWNSQPAHDIARVRRIGFLIYPDFEIVDLCGPLDAFFYAEHFLRTKGRAREPGYECVVVAKSPGLVKSRCGLEINATCACVDVTDSLDTLVVAGGEGAFSACADEQLLEWLRLASTRVRRLASVCTGAFLLAAAGLLNNRRATTHWLFSERLAADYPSLDVEPNRIFVRDGGVYTSGGITAGIDLTLALIEEDLGRDVPRMVAGMMVVFLRRPGGQTQFSPFLEPVPGSCRDIGELKSWILGNAGEELSIERLARQLSMSPRNFARRFREEAGMTPAKFVEFARLEVARCRLEQTNLSLELIAAHCGFGTAERMRRTFQRRLNVGPLEYRERFQSTVSTCEDGYENTFPHHSE
jgi:transcriptional regulator GlxA family with amidase domain